MFLVSPSNRFAMDAWHILAEIHGIDIDLPYIRMECHKVGSLGIGISSPFLGIIILITQK